MDHKTLTSAKSLLLTLVVAALALAGCTPDEKHSTPSTARTDSVLQNTARHVIYPTYATLHTEARSLLVATRAFQQRPTAGNLEAARQAWRDARAAWESGQAFLLGPVTTKKFASVLDSWPIDEAGLERVLAGSDSLTHQRIDRFQNTRKGFHALEYLLFGKQGAKPVADFTDRHIAYLTGAARALEQTTEKLAAGWSPDADNYARTFVTAGTSNNRTFYSKSSALRQLVVSMAKLAQKLAAEKLGAPLASKNAQHVESRFSGNALADFKNNVESLQHLYTGDYRERNGPGLDEIVKAQKPALHERFRRELDAARQALDQIPPPFRTALTEHPGTVRRAQAAARQLARTLDGDIKPLVIALY